MATQCDGLTDEEMTQYGGIAYWLDGIGQASRQLTKLLSLVYKNSQDRTGTWSHTILPVHLTTSHHGRRPFYEGC